MKILINIPDSAYKLLKDKTEKTALECSVANGTILPEKHGRLIDEDYLVEVIDQKWKTGSISASKFTTYLNILDEIPTVVEEQ